MQADNARAGEKLVEWGVLHAELGFAFLIQTVPSEIQHAGIETSQALSRPMLPKPTRRTVSSPIMCPDEGPCGLPQRR